MTSKFNDKSAQKSSIFSSKAHYVRGLFLFFFLSFIGVVFSSESPRELPLFLIQSGRIDQGLNLYKQTRQKEGKHDFELLQEMGLLLLRKGQESGDKETEILTLLGAGASLNEQTLPILEAGLQSPHPEIQLISLGLLSRYSHGNMTNCLTKALRSDSLLVRYEALLLLVNQKSELALPQILSLLAKVDDEVWPLFAPLFVKLGTKEANLQLRRFLAHPKESVRLATIASLQKGGRDDFLEDIRRLSQHPSPGEKEAAASALGALKDSASIPLLEQLAKSPHLSVSLAATFSLYKLGKADQLTFLTKKASTGNLFAITLLGEIPEAKNTLTALLSFPSSLVKVNAALALLALGDPVSLPIIKECLTSTLGLTKTSSIGNSLVAWKVMNAEALDDANSELISELFLEEREKLLKKAACLPEEYFLPLAKELFAKRENALIPTLCACLECLNTPNAILLLKEQQQRVGAPLIRLWCTLTLYKLDADDNAFELLKKWLATKQSMELINLRPLMPRELSDDDDAFTLNTNESSRLLLETLESLASKQEDVGLDILLDIIQNGHPKNRFALAGLLMRSAL